MAVLEARGVICVTVEPRVDLRNRIDRYWHVSDIDMPEFDGISPKKHDPGATSAMLLRVAQCGKISHEFS
jgi:hypothetical protein